MSLCVLSQFSLIVASIDMAAAMHASVNLFDCFRRTDWPPRPCMKLVPSRVLPVALPCLSRVTPTENLPPPPPPPYINPRPQFIFFYSKACAQLLRLAVVKQMIISKQ